MNDNTPSHPQDERSEQHRVREANRRISRDDERPVTREPGEADSVTDANRRMTSDEDAGTPPDAGKAGLLNPPD